MSMEPTPPDEEAPSAEEESQGAAREGSAAREKAWRERMMVGVGWTALLSVVAVIIAISALGASNPKTTIDLTQARAAVTTAPAQHQAVKLIVKSGDEHGKLGPGGVWHDAFLPADFTVHPGARVTVTVLNYDNMPHSFTASSLSPSTLMNQTIAAGSATAPSTTTFTFTAPSSPGKYAWWCAMPCDPYSMAHDGYMRGYVTVAA